MTYSFPENNALGGVRAESSSLTSGVTQWLTVIGVNEDAVSGLSEAARQAISAASWVVGGKRHLAHVDPLISGRTHEWLSPITESLEFIRQLKSTRLPVVVLASGDPFFYGIGSVLTRIIPFEEMTVLPAPSALTLACSTMGWAQQAVEVVSLCGRPIENLASCLESGRKLLVLTSGSHSPGEIVAYLRQHHYEDSDAVLLEALGGPAQHVLSFKVAEFNRKEEEINPLNMLAITLSEKKQTIDLSSKENLLETKENLTVAARALSVTTEGLPVEKVGLPGRENSLFQHDGQITRREIRALSLSRLQPTEGDVLWDLGAGSGAVSIEWLLSNPSLRAVAIEQHSQRVAFIRHNAETFNVSGRLTLHEGSLEKVLLPLKGHPNAVFIGGGASVALIEQMIERLTPGGRLLVNAVTLQTEQLVAGCQQRFGGELTRIGLEHLTPLGALHGWAPARTITQWYWKKS